MATFTAMKNIELTKEFVLENVRLCVKPKSDEEILKTELADLPDLEAYYRVFMEDGSFKLTEKIVEQIPGLEYEELLTKAVENVQENAYVFQMFGALIIASNKEKMHGASVMLCPGKLHEICENTGVKRLIIIPSSVHEVICQPDDGGLRIEDCNKMVRQVNATELLEEDILADHVYIYDDETGKVTMP